ncbi:MAG: DNA recombination protein RmuC [Bacilli bacterium]|nr:DNA recombination protein RmuC [Bacilli bacterium]
MTDTLLIVVISLLSCLIILMLVLLFKRSKNPLEGKITGEMRDLLEQNRMKSFKDLSEEIKEQNQEIQVLKDAITNSMNEAQKTNQNDLYKFLEETKTKLSDLQRNFNKESADVKTQNLTNILDLIAQTTKDINELKTKILKEINESNTKNSKDVNDQNIKTQERINTQIELLKEKVQESLNKGFEKNEKAINDFIEKTASIEASARQMEELRKEISRFRDILVNNKARGNFGEAVLEGILTSIFGSPENNLHYRTQVNITQEFGLKLSKGHSEDSRSLTVDFLFNIVTNNGSLPLSIDAKFPYNNYAIMLDDNISSFERGEAKKKFGKDVKDRIGEVKKYIVEGKTAPYAVMFIPAESVFIDIFKEFPDIVEEARKQKVIMASPSLIVTIIQILQFILNDYKVRDNADQILKLIDEIGKEFNLFTTRWEEHKKRIQSLSEDVKKIDTTTNKLISKFDKTKNIVSDGTKELEIDDKNELKN